jgi:hypothetical protein
MGLIEFEISWIEKCLKRTQIQDIEFHLLFTSKLFFTSIIRVKMLLHASLSTISKHVKGRKILLQIHKENKSLNAYSI